mmetsp:Transcript_14694/g.21682  ORF Transcript_14694/g.21682 Transcript_14694/m.21682 type:complete len:217 (-) Transcript_14694:676-1326(-)
MFAHIILISREKIFADIENSVLIILCEKHLLREKLRFVIKSLAHLSLQRLILPANERKPLLKLQFTVVIVLHLLTNWLKINNRKVTLTPIKTEQINSQYRQVPTGSIRVPQRVEYLAIMPNIVVSHPNFPILIALKAHIEYPCFTITAFLVRVISSWNHSQISQILLHEVQLKFPIWHIEQRRSIVPNRFCPGHTPPVISSQNIIFYITSKISSTA